MRLHRTPLVVSVLCLILAYAAPQLLAGKKDKPPEATQNERKRALHALNRLTFGPRPGDVQAVLNMGVDKWIDGDAPRTLPHIAHGCSRNSGQFP